MARKTIKDIIFNTNFRCVKVYPVENSDKKIKDLETVGISLTKEQAIELARALLVASQDWDIIDITAYRKKPRESDNSFPITITSFIKE